MSNEDKPIGDVVGDTVQEHHQEDMTANEDLRELVEEWRNPPDDVSEMAVEMAELFANELETVYQKEIEDNE